VRSRPSGRKSPTHAEIAESLAAAYSGVDETEDELTSAANAAVDLVQAGKLDEAEQAARDLIARFPDAHDGWDRLGMVYEARGDQKQAADCYRKVIDFIRAHPEQYDPKSRPSSISSLLASTPQPLPDRDPVMLTFSDGAEPAPITNCAPNHRAIPSICGRGLTWWGLDEGHARCTSSQRSESPRGGW
jgi:tetratricopeptide (TPR) repeat protein